MTRVLLITAGKGGTGKTTLTSNLAAALSQLGQDVVAVDVNLTTPNLGLHTGLHLAPNTIHDVLKGTTKLKDATYPHYLGYKIIPGGMSVEDLKNVDVGRLNEISMNLIGKTDFVLFDSAAGLGREAVSAISATQEVLVITNPDLPSVADALKTIKIAEATNKKILGVVVNRKKSKWHEMFKSEIEEMTGYEVLAEIPEDSNVPKSIALKMPVVQFKPDSPASIEIRRLAHWLIDRPFKQKFPFRLALFDSLVNWMSR